MTTKRKQSCSTSKVGVKFAEAVAIKNNCIFQEISQENDIGNDAYLEFIRDEQATGCCIALQIKSGDSYINRNGNFVLKADKDHFEYWYSHVLPIAAIIYSPTKNYAVWFDITKYLSQSSSVIETGPYNVEIPIAQEFSPKTFNIFMTHFLQYLEAYKHKLGIALEKFADISNPRNCLDGIKYLFSFQRQNIASWYYLINCLQNFRHHPLLPHLVSTIAYLPGHEDIFWHRENVIQDQTREAALSHLKERFGRIEVLCMLEILTDGGGFSRGAIGQSVNAIIGSIKDNAKILESVAFDNLLNEDVRYWALLLLVYYTQWGISGKEKCLTLINRYKNQFSNEDSEISDMVSGIYEELLKYERFNLFC